MQAVKSPFADLLRPMEPSNSVPAPKPETSPGDATAATQGVPPVSPGSEASASGSITAEQALSGLDHTKINPVSMSGAPGATGPTPLTGATPGPSVSLGGMVQAEWAIGIMDSLLPALIVAAFYYFGVKLRKSEMQLTEKERQTLTPVLQAYLNSVLISFSGPGQALAFTLIGIYGGKLAEKGLVALIDKKQEEQQAEALAAKMAAAERSDDPAKFDYANASAADIQAGKVVTPVNEYPFTEEDIRARMKRGKCGRDAAIKYLMNRAKKAA